MLVEFRKTGARRYGVFVERIGAPAMMMHPAPGFDEFLPHDLLHFVAEAEWGLDGAVFGQLAAGGDAGTFWPIEQTLVRKSIRRRKRRGKSFGRGGRSELLAGVLESAWNARHARAALPEDWDERCAAARVEPDRLQAIVVTLDDLAERWHRLRVGDSLTLEWPRRRTRRTRQPQRRERAHSRHRHGAPLSQR